MHLHNLNKRDWGSSSWTGSGGARWAFFAVFIVLILIVVLGTIKVNKRRSKQGIQPLYGTRWMTPPSYVQSQTQYNQPNTRDPDMPTNYVPAYSAEATEYDMGYYDNSGKFHANPNAKSQTPVDVLQASDVEYPPSAHQRLTSMGTGAPVGRIPTLHEETEDDDRANLDDMYRPPPGPPPFEASSATSDDAESPPGTPTIPGQFPTTNTQTTRS